MRCVILSLFLVSLFVLSCQPTATPSPPIGTSTPVSTTAPAAASPTALAPTATRVEPTATTPAATSTARPTSLATAQPTPISALTYELTRTLTAKLPPPPTPKPGKTPSGPTLHIAAFPLQQSVSGNQIWAAYSYGMRDFDAKFDHFLAIYSLSAGGWREVTRLVLQNADYLGLGSIQQVQIEPSRVWLQLDAGVGAHGGLLEIITFDGAVLKEDVIHFSPSPVGGFVRDLNGDGKLDVLLPQSDPYVFCYACFVRYEDWQALAWDGRRLAEVKLTNLPDSAPTEVRRLNNLAVKLASGGLYKDALPTIAQALALSPTDPTVIWNSFLIELVGEARAAQAKTEIYPLLQYTFYGDYGPPLAEFRKVGVSRAFGPQSALIVGTPAAGWADSVAYWITTTTTLVIQAEPNLAAAYFLRGWAQYLGQAKSASGLADIETAARLDNKEPLYKETVRYLKGQ